MRSKSFKKSLAASAVFASSVATGVGFAASAQATTAGGANSPLTITNGTNSVLVNGQAQQYESKINQGAWAPDGSRIAYVDGNNNVVTERAGGSGLTVVAPAKAGATRSNPTWADNGTLIVFSETVNGVSKIQAVPAYTVPGDKVDQTDPLSFLGTKKLTEGAETAPDSNGKTLAFQHHNASSGQDEIWVQDAFGRGSAGPILAAADGESPSVSPDGKTIAFLRKDSAGDEQIWTVAWNGQEAPSPAGTAKQLTTDAHDHLHPTFSPDGSHIAYEAGPGKGAPATEVDTMAADGAGQNQASNKAGVPAYQPAAANTMVRLQGSDRIGTAIAASQAQFVTAPGNPQAAGKYPAGSVVLSRSDDFADALGGSTLASAEDGPLLLTPSDHLDAGVKAEISRVLGPAAKATGTVYILGGEKALSPAVAKAVHDMGYKVQRISGPDRYATSVAIAEQVTHGTTSWQQPDRVLVATGNLAPDALSAGAAAEAQFSGPALGVVILTDDKKMPASTNAYLAQVKAHDSANYTTPVYGVGGQADTALTSIGFKHTGLVGVDRYQTSYLVAKTFFGDWQQGMTTAPASVGFATGLTWADALSGGAFMSHERGPLILVDPKSGEPASAAEKWVTGWSSSITTGYVFGGTAAVPPVTDTGMGNLIGKMGGQVNYEINPKA